MSDGAATLLAIVGMTCVTVLTRSMFFLSSKPWQMPKWAETGLQYAPLAALIAVIAPEIFMTQGQLISTWKDARLFALAAGSLWFVRRKSLLGTILVGMAVYLPLHVWIGW